MVSAQKSIRDRAQGRVGTVLKEKWQIEALLGVGGSASVYAATHRNGKRAAIKILHPELSLDDEIVGRFLREGYAANKLDHPGAVSVLDDDRTDDGAVYLVMELLDGVSLERFTRAKGERMPLHQVLSVADSLLDVLAAAHAKGVVHRDIKPANLFLTRDGRLKVLDFGIARLTQGLGDDAVATQTGAAIGTPAFMPPEQARGRSNEVDARTDIWAVGATLFALLSGQRPRRAETVNEELLMAMTQPVPALASAAPSVPAEVCAIVDRACAFDKQHRWQDAREMQVALRRFADGLHPVVESSPSSTSLQPDTAPVLNGAEGLDLQLTTSRPLVRGSALAQASTTHGGPSKRRVMLVAFAGTFAFGAGALAVLLHVQRGRRADAQLQYAAPSPSAEVSVAPSPALSEVAPPVIAPAVTASAAETPSATGAVAALPSGNAHVTTHAAPPVHRTQSAPKPSATASSKSLFDQRF